MENGYITGYIDVAQITLYVFWAFFFGLIFWLRKEDRREGYPLESDPSGAIGHSGIFLTPKPKTFHLRDGSSQTVPREARDQRPIAARRAGRWPGAPLIPTGNPLVDGVGPAAWAERADQPDKTFDNKNRIAPTRAGQHWSVAAGDPDPRGMTVVGADRRAVGTVTDMWIDQSEHIIRYLEVDLGAGAGVVLVPKDLARISEGKVKVKSLLAAQFADVPRTKAPESVTMLEEDKICAYFAGGNLYATRARSEPLL